MTTLLFYRQVSLGKSVANSNCLTFQHQCAMTQTTPPPTMPLIACLIPNKLIIALFQSTLQDTTSIHGMQSVAMVKHCLGPFFIDVVQESLALPFTGCQYHLETDTLRRHRCRFPRPECFQGKLTRMGNLEQPQIST